MVQEVIRKALVRSRSLESKLKEEQEFAGKSEQGLGLLAT